VKLFRLFQKTPSFNTQSISCCELTQFDCNQGRNCPLRASAPSLRAERGNLQTQTRHRPRHVPSRCHQQPRLLTARPQQSGHLAGVFSGDLETTNK
jgi:hypothetical protein